MGLYSHKHGEKIWIQRIQKGDHHAFEHLFREYYLPLTRFAWRFVDCTTGAEELVQEVFATVWEKRESLEINGSPKAYLYKIVRNRALNFLRHNKTKSEYHTLWMNGKEKTAMPEFEKDERDETEKIRKLIGQAIEELPPRSRMTYKLHRYDGLTYEEIADVMNVSVKTVESQMTRTLKILRERLTVLLPVR